MLWAGDEHADLGRSALLRIQHADLVIGQAYLGDLRVELAQALAQSDVKRGLECGAADYFTKPVDISTLVTRLRELVPKARE